MLATALAGAVQAAACAVSSGAGTAALVELYTAHGCPRCQSAERWLLDVASSAQDVIPLVLYVNSGALPQRERRLTPRQRMALVFTPAVKLQGRDFESWDSPAFDRALSRIAAQPARARLRLEIRSAQATSFRVEARAEVLDRGLVEEAVLYLAAYERRSLGTVQEWQGPAAFRGPALVLEREIPLPAGARAADSGVVGFVLNRGNAGVLQALMLASCP